MSDPNDGSADAVTRPLNNSERAVLLRVLDQDLPGVEAARAQVDHAHYAGPSDGDADMCFELTVEGEVPLILLSGGPAFGSLVYSGSECTGTIDLWVSDGRLDSVEYSWFTDDPPTVLPTVDQIFHMEQPSKKTRKRWWRRAT